jgi:hypothetical protein
VQKKRDSIDETIFEAFIEVEPDYDYNRRLIEKIHANSLNRRDKIRPVAVSLILSGIITMLLYTSNFQFRFLDFKYKVITHMIAFQYNYKVDIQRIILGE